MFTTSLIFFEHIILGLTPTGRFRAAGRFESSITSGPWFIVIFAAIALAVIVALIVVVWKRIGPRGKKSGESFFEQAQRRGLSSRESQILLRVAKLAGLKQAESVFTMGKAFDLGAGKLSEPAYTHKMTPKQIEQLGKELSYIREKLGFKKKLISTSEPIRISHERSSREIPLGKKVHMTRRLGRNSEDIDATVIKNTDSELTVRLAGAVGSGIGERWRVRYYYGASVWEFDVSVAGSDGQVLILNHSDNIRFINRRRFLRVPVRRKAYIAPFAFERRIKPESLYPASNNIDVFDDSAVLPRFVPATVTELAGPGLLIETSLPLKERQRVAVIFDLDVYDDVRDKSTHTVQAKRIVEDIGIVRHTSEAGKGYSVAVELTGLSDFDVNGLVRATNAAAVNLRTKNSWNLSVRHRNSAELAGIRGN